MGFSLIILEGDALGVVTTLNSDMEDLSLLGNIIFAGRMKADYSNPVLSSLFEEYVIRIPTF
ncbi:hypothetical protein PTKIN_Ptkin15bG0075000 [Pterospermum kingtungense]